MNRAEQIDAFCSALYGGPDGTGDDRLDGYSTYAWTLDTTSPVPRKTTVWAPASPQDLAALLHTHTARQPEHLSAIYISPGIAPQTVAAEKGARKRLSADDVTGLPGLWADIDIAGPGHAGTHYPPDQDAAMAIVGALGIEPTIVVHTGGGLQAYWCFTEPWLTVDGADPEAEREVMAELSMGLVNSLRWYAGRLGGWTVDSVFNIDRVLRAPGSLNCKNGGAVPVRLLRCDPTVRYEPDEIREHLAPEEELAQIRQRSMTGGRSGEAVARELPGLDLAAAWRVAQTSPDHIPTWLEDLLEMDAGSPLDHTWSGDRPDLAGDQNRFDAALVRLLADIGAGVQQQAEAVMARRLRAGVNVEKVDPGIRQDYLIRTLLNVADSVAASVAAKQQERAVRSDRLEAAKRAAATATTTTATTTTATIPPPTPGSIPPPTVPSTQPPASPPTAPTASRTNGHTVSGSSALAPEPEVGREPPEDPPGPEADDFGDAVAESINTDQAPRDQPPPRPVRARPLAAVAPVAEPEPAPAHVVAQEPWRERSPEHEAIMDALSDVLFPEEYRSRGAKVWELQQRDRGPAALGRLVLWLPEDFGWPGDYTPDLYRPGRPFHLAWRKRQEFETPAGYRRALEHDAKIPALPVAAHQDDWPGTISSLIPYWRPDSSGTDLPSQTCEWLFDYVTSRAPTMDEVEAQQNQTPYLVDHKGWGTLGVPVIYIAAKSFLDYVAVQPGGSSGRDARGLLDYLHTVERRLRFAQHDGRSIRQRWLEIEARQFRRSEWQQIVDIAQQAQSTRQIRVVRGRDAG